MTKVNIMVWGKYKRKLYDKDEHGLRRQIQKKLYDKDEHGLRQIQKRLYDKDEHGLRQIQKNYGDKEEHGFWHMHIRMRFPCAFVVGK